MFEYSDCAGADRALKMAGIIVPPIGRMLKALPWFPYILFVAAVLAQQFHHVLVALKRRLV